MNKNVRLYMLNIFLISSVTPQTSIAHLFKKKKPTPKKESAAKQEKKGNPKPYSEVNTSFFEDKLTKYHIDELNKRIDKILNPS